MGFIKKLMNYLAKGSTIDEVRQCLAIKKDNSISVGTLKQLCSDFILSLQTHLSPTSAADIES